MFNVLIVDDDSMVAELNRLFISRVADFRCCGIASTLAEAEQMLNHARDRFDPAGCVHAARERTGSAAHPAYDARSIDAIMITSAADAATVQTAMRYGVVDYLIKPFQFPRFEEALLTWRKRRELQHAKSRYEQSDVDDLLRSGIQRRITPAAYLKGLTPQTLRPVCQWIDSHQENAFSTNGSPTRCKSPEFRAVSI